VSSPAERRDRIEALLASRATEGVAGPELAELADLLAGQREYGWDDFDRAAAALDLAFGAGRVEPLPAGVRAAVEARAREWFRARRG